MYICQVGICLHNPLKTCFTESVNTICLSCLHIIDFSSFCKALPQKSLPPFVFIPEKSIQILDIQSNKGNLTLIYLRIYTISFFILLKLCFAGLSSAPEIFDNSF